MGNGVLAAIAVLLVDDGKLLLGRRIRDDQFEGWQCPGGYIRSNEELSAAAQRCCMQKAGVRIGDIEQGPFTNNIFHSSKSTQHSVSLYTIARKFEVINSALSTDAELQWQWFEIDDLPLPRFQPLKQLLEHYDLQSVLGIK